MKIVKIIFYIRRIQVQIFQLQKLSKRHSC